MSDTPRTDAIVKDCAAIIRRLCRAVKRCEPQNTLPEQAMDFLLRNGITGQILRDDDMPDVDIQELLQNVEDLNVKNAQLETALTAAESALASVTGERDAAAAEKIVLKLRCGTFIDDCERISGYAASQVGWDEEAIDIIQQLTKRAESAEAKLREQDALLARCAVMFETGNTISVPRELHSEFVALKMDLDNAISKPPCQK